MFIRKRNFLQLICLNFVNLLLSMYLGSVKPFKIRSRNRLELTNEMFNSLATVHFCCFTDFVEDISTQFKIGWSLCLLIVLNIVFNLSLVFIGQLHSSKLIIIKYYRILKRNYKRYKETGSWTEIIVEPVVPPPKKTEE